MTLASDWGAETTGWPMARAPITSEISICEQIRKQNEFLFFCWHHLDGSFFIWWRFRHQTFVLPKRSAAAPSHGSWTEDWSQPSARCYSEWSSEQNQIPNRKIMENRFLFGCSPHDFPLLSLKNGCHLVRYHAQMWDLAFNVPGWALSYTLPIPLSLWNIFHLWIHISNYHHSTRSKIRP